MYCHLYFPQFRIWNVSLCGWFLEMKSSNRTELENGKVLWRRFFHRSFLLLPRQQNVNIIWFKCKLFGAFDWNHFGRKPRTSIKLRQYHCYFCCLPFCYNVLSLRRYDCSRWTQCTPWLNAGKGKLLSSNISMFWYLGVLMLLYT